MSYEGSVYVICADGHLDTIDCQESIEEFRCTSHDARGRCGARGTCIWAVDDTNGDACGHIKSEDWERFLLIDAEYETCNMGHPHMIRAARYRIPTTEELQAVSCYWDDSTKAFKYSKSRD